MDITLIESGKSHWDREAQKDVVFDTEMTRLVDCGMILLHKIGLRPLYVEGNDLELKFEEKPQKQMEKPNLILFSTNEADTQSAQILQLQLISGNCPVEIKQTDFIEKTANVSDKKIYQNMFKTYLNSFEKKGYKHIVIVADKKNLDRMVYSLNNTGLNEQYTFPIYSFSDGQEIVDKNLINAMYITRDILDSVLLWQFEHSKAPQFKAGKGKYRFALTSDYLKYKLKLPNTY